MLGRLIRFYVYSNLHISFCAAIYVASSFVIAEEFVGVDYVLFVFSGTYVIYNIHRFISNTKIETTEKAKRHTIFNQSKWSLYLLLAIASLTAFYTYVNLGIQYWRMLLIPMVISALYIIPIYKKLRLRDANYIKIMLIAIAWASFFVIPIWNSDSSFPFFLWLSQILYFIAITIPFDIRDRQIDQQQGLLTIANVLSTKQSVRLALALLILSLTCIYLADLGTILILLLGSYVISGLLICISEGKEEFYHLAYLDGLIGLQGLIILISLYF